MRLIIFSVCFLLLLSCKQKEVPANLETQIQEVFQQTEGTFAVAFKDLSSGKKLFINEKESFHAASTMKTPVMIEVYKQVGHGVLSLEDSVLVKNEFYSIVDSSVYQLTVGEDSEEALYGQVGKKKAIKDLVYDMIIVSSNLATNLVIDLVDARKVTQTMRQLGAPDINVLRGVEDIKAFDLGMSNSTTAFDLMVIFEKIAKGEAVNKKASEEMIEILLDQKFNEIIPALLPKEVKVAHKTGAITGVHHDSGIVFLPDGRKYILVLLSKELKDFDAGTEAMAKVSKLIYDDIISHSPTQSQ
jgi:beta-lactamase class A